MEIININTEYIKLDSFMKLCNIVDMGSLAKYIIQKGLVKVNGEIELKRGKKLYVGDEISYNGIRYKIVSNN